MGVGYYKISEMFNVIRVYILGVNLWYFTIVLPL